MFTTFRIDEGKPWWNTGWNIHILHLVLVFTTLLHVYFPSRIFKASPEQIPAAGTRLTFPKERNVVLLPSYGIRSRLWSFGGVYLIIMIWILLYIIKDNYVLFLQCSSDSGSLVCFYMLECSINTEVPKVTCPADKMRRTHSQAVQSTDKKSSFSLSFLMELIPLIRTSASYLKAFFRWVCV